MVHTLGGAGTTQDHARKLDTDPVEVQQEFGSYAGGEAHVSFTVLTRPLLR